MPNHLSPVHSRMTAIAIAVAIAGTILITCYAFGAMLGNGFFADDWQHLENVVTHNPLDYATRTLDVRQPHYFYRPVPRLIMYAQAAMLGLHASGYHLTSLLLHIANSLLWGALLWVICGRLLMLPAAALAFAVFPVFADAVFWVSDTEILLALFFGLGCLLAWARFVIAGSRSAYVVSLLCLVLALLSKEAAVFLAPMMVVLVGAMQRRWPGWRSYAPIGFIMAVFLLLDMSVVVRDVPLWGSSYSLGAHALANAVRYLLLLVTPFHRWASDGAAGYVRLLLAALCVVWLLLKDGRRTVFLLAWVGCALFPYVAFNDRLTMRYVYAAAFGATGLLAFAVVLLSEQRGRLGKIGKWLATAACALLVIAMANDVRSRQMEFAATTHTQENTLYHVQALHQSFPPGSSLYFLNAPVPGRYLASMMRVAYDTSLHVSAVDESELLESSAAAPVFVFHYSGDKLEEMVFSPPLPSLKTTLPLPVRFGPTMSLVGYDVPAAAIRPGQTLLVLLYWRSQGPADRSYTAFAHLVDPGWTMWAQSDSLPQEGRAPTNTWQRDQFVGDYYFLRVPPDAPPGRDYRIELGFYETGTLQRLAVVDERGSAIDDRVLIETVAVE